MKFKINSPSFVICLFFFASAMFLVWVYAYAASDSVQVEQDVINCNNNGMCEAWESNDSCPNDCHGAGGHQGKRRHMSVNIIPDMEVPEINSVRIEPDIHSARISWKTTEPAVSRVVWGKTRDYEEASLSEVIFSSNHAIKIENLLPSSRYFFKIVFSDMSGNENLIEGLSFVTMPPSNTEAPANVSNLRARLVGGVVLLSWKNPDDEDFATVRITKRNNFYPRDPLEGKVVYEGRGTGVKDKEIKRGSRYYYSVFSRDKNWNYSSGAIVSVFVPEEKLIKKTGKQKIRKEEIKKMPEQIKKPSLMDFDFVQGEKKISFAGDRIKIKTDKNLKISINANKIPREIKKISLELRNPKNSKKPFLFMFKLKKDEGVFETVISPIEGGETYPFVVHFKDKKGLELKKIKAEIIPIATEKKGVGETFRKIANDVSVIFRKITSPMVNAFLGIIKFLKIF